MGLVCYLWGKCRQSNVSVPSRIGATSDPGFQPQQPRLSDPDRRLITYTYNVLPCLLLHVPTDVPALHQGLRSGGPEAIGTHGLAPNVNLLTGTNAKQTWNRRSV